MKRYFKSGYNYIQDMVLEPGTYTFWARILSNFGDTFTFALANEAGEWEVFDIDVEMGQWSKVYEVFNITEKKVKLDLIHRYYDSEQPVFVFKPQLIKGNIPTDAGASPYDIDQITDDLHDSINGIADFTNEEFADRVLSASERISLKRDMEAVETIFQSLKGSYEKLIINPFVPVAVTTDLTTKYNAVTSAKTELFNVLNLIIAGDNIVTPEEITAKDAALLALNTALYNYNLAEKEIQNALGEDYTQKISAIRDFTDNEFADRMISETEKISLSHDLDSVQTLVDSVTSRFNEMLLNPFLTEADRNLLIEKYNALLDAWDWDESVDPAKQNGLKTVILNIINDPDNIIDPVEMAEKDLALSAFNIALGEFSQTEVYISKITIDYAIEQATFWSLNATSPVIYKDAKDAVTDGHHMPVTVKGQLHRGTQIQDGGYLTVTADDAAEAAEATASPVLIEPADSDDKSLYTIRLYDSAAKTILLDTMIIPVVFRGANGQDAINITLSNEIDSVPADNDGVVSSYDNTGTDIRVFEGVTELTYDGSGTSPGTFKVTSLGIDLTVGQISSPTVGILKCVVGNISNLIADKGITQFTITGKTLGNESFSEVKEQRITKGKMGDTGRDSINVVLEPSSYAYSLDSNGNLKGNIYDGVFAIEVTAGGVKLTCPDTSNTAPTVDNTYKVTSVAQQVYVNPDAWVSGGQYNISATEMFVGDTAPITITVVARINGTNYSFVRTFVYSKVTDGEDGDGITSVTVEYAKDASGSVPPNTGWSTAIPSVTLGWYLWTRTTITYKVAATTVSYTSSRWADNGSDGHSPYIDTTTNTWWTWDGTAYVNTGYSPIGAAGVVPYPAGYYDQYAQYVRTATTAPYVQNGGVYYLLKQTPPSSGYPTSNTTYWEAFDGFSAIYTDILLANFAKLNSAVFSGDKMISQQGVNNSGVPSTDYQNFPASFTPNILLDFLLGTGHLAGGKISWDANGNLEVVGAINSNSSGSRIRIDPIQREILLINSSDQEVGRIGFGSVGGSLTFKDPLTGDIKTSYNSNGMTMMSPAGSTNNILSVTANNILLDRNIGSSGATFWANTEEDVLKLYARGLPTSPSGLTAGQLYRDTNGFLKVV